MASWSTPPASVKAAIAILEDALPGILVTPRVPKTRPTQFVRVTRAGGGLVNPVTDSPRILVECWATSYGQAETMANTARAALRNAQSQYWAGIFVRRWRWDSEDGPVDWPDPDVTDMERFQFHGDLEVSIN